MKNFRLTLLTLILPLTAFAELTIITESLHDGAVGEEYSQIILELSGAEDGATNEWSIEGNFPPGLTQNGNKIYDSPTKSGIYGFKVKVTSTNAGEDGEPTPEPLYAEKEFTIKIPLKITTNYALTDGQLGTSYSKTLETAGYSDNGSDKQVTWSATSLPSGLSINSTTGIISGTPTANGTFNVTATTDAEGEDGNSDYNTAIKQFEIQFKPKITTTSLVKGEINKSYNQILTAIGYISYWSKIDGDLPQGLSLNSSTGVISGTPTTAGTYQFTIQAEGTYSSDSKELSITIQSPKPTITANYVQYPSSNIVRVSQPGSWGFSSDQNVKWEVISGSLSEAGLSFEKDNSISSSTNAIIGTPTKAGSFKFTIRVTNSDGTTSDEEFRIGIAPASPAAAFYKRADGLLWTPDVSKSPSLQVQVPEVVNCPDCENTAGWWYGYKYGDGAHKVQVKLDGSYVDFENVSLANVDGTSRISETGMELKMQIDEVPANNYYGTGISFDLRKDDKATNIYQGQGYCIEYSSDAPVTLELGWPSAYGDNNYYYTLPAAEDGFQNIQWSSFSNQSPFEGGPYISESVSYNEATQLKIVFKSGAYSSITPAGTVNFKLKQLGWYCKTKPTITTNGPFNTVVNENVWIDLSSDQSASWSIIEGSLPPGLNLQYTSGNRNYNYISGTPTTADTYTFTLKVENDIGSTTKEFTINVRAPEAPVITQSSLQDGTMGEYYWQNLYAGDYANWSLSGNVPPGLSLENDGYTSYNYISGTPTATGEFTFTVTATNISGSDSKPFTITINGEEQAPTITSDNVPEDGVKGDYFSGYIYLDRAANWSLSGNIPPGLSLQNTGYTRENRISGTFTATGTYTFTITVTNSQGSNSREFTITITEPPAPEIEIDGSLNITLGESVDLRLYSDQYVWWSVENLPAWLYLDNDNDWQSHYNYIYGTPTSAGTYPFTIRVTNSAGISSTKTITINVRAPERPTITTTSPLPNGIKGEGYSIYLEATDYAQWSYSGNLPPGLWLYSDGEIYGTPTSVGTFTFTVVAWNDAGEDTKQLAITIGDEQQPPTITSDNVPSSGRAGDSFNGYIYSDRAANWSLSGNVPPGLSLQNTSYTTSSRISGTPTATGTYTFTVTATNSRGSNSRTFTLTIAPEQYPPTITYYYDVPEDGVKGNFFDSYLSSDRAAYWSLSGNIPPGLSLQNTGYTRENRISGTFTATGTYTFTITVTNSQGSNSREFTITITEPPPPQIEIDEGSPNITLGESVDLRLYSDQYVWWSVENLPAWLYLDNDNDWQSHYNYIYGRPTQAGTYPFTIRVTNSAGISSTETITINVRAPERPTITTTSPLPNGIKGEGYSIYLEATDYAQWSINDYRNFPPGLNLYSDGEIYGYPSEVGTYTFTVRAQNNAGYDTKQLTITIGDEQQPPTITSDNVPSSGRVGDSFYGYIYSDRAANWSITSGSLPPGLSLSYSSNTNNISISGYPSEADTYTFTVTATNSRGSNSRTFNVTIAPELYPPRITYYNVPPEGVKNDYFYGHLESNRAANWSITSGSLPPGLSFQNDGYTSSNRISGTPTATGTYTFTVTVTNSVSTDSREFTITITEPPPPQIEIDEGSLYITLGESVDLWLYSDQYVTWSVEGSLPEGFRLYYYGQRNYNRIFGTPSAVGELTFTLKVTNSAGISNTKTFTINIAEPPAPAISTNTLPNGTVGSSYYGQLTSSPTNVKWSITSGSLPPGLSLGEDGYLSGTPKETGTYTFLAKAENVAGLSGTQWLTINIDLPTSPIISTNTLPDGTVGSSYYGQLTSSPNATWSTESALPPGLSLYSNGYISGYPKEAGTYTFLAKAENTAGSSSQWFTIIIKDLPLPPILEITTNILLNGAVNVNYWALLESSPTNATWSIEGGLPPGLSLYSNGYVYGYPKEAGTYTFLAKAENAAGSSTKWFTIVISEELQNPTIITETIPDGEVYVPYSISLEATNRSLWSKDGNLPAGLSLENNAYSNKSRIFGTPLTAGTYTFTVLAMNEFDLVGTKEITITIRENQATCAANGKIWENGTCRAKTAKEECNATPGYTWSGSACRLSAELALENACISGGGVWESGSCRARTSQEKCTAAGMVWENDNCRARTPQELCIALGNIWENSTCRAKTPEEACIAAGKFWVDGVCKTRITSLPQIASTRNILLNTTGNAILLSNLPSNTKVDVYNLQGKLMYSGHSENSQILKIPVQAGMYMVKAGSQKLRAVVK